MHNKTLTADNLAKKSWPHNHDCPLCYSIPEQLTALGIEPGDQDLAANSLAALKSELAEEKVACKKAQAEAETPARAVEDLKKIADRFAIQIPILEEKVKHLDNKVLDWFIELCAKVLNLERTTKANEDYKSQNARLTQKLESKHLSPLPPGLVFYLIYY
jgi:hypothetical protein